MARDIGPAAGEPDNDNEVQRVNALPIVITPERADELATLYAAKTAEGPPFAGQALTRDEVRWLMHNRSDGEEGPDLRSANLQDVDLSGPAHMRGNVFGKVDSGTLTLSW